jgi:signal transduction histidine kinase/CheY-like chemotaxis protein
LFYSGQSMRIRSFLLLAAAAVLVPGFLAATMAVEQAKEAERQAALRGLRETVRATALLVDREIQASLSTLGALGSSPHLDTGRLDGLYEQAKRLDRPPDVWTLLLDEGANQLFNTARPFGAPPPAALPAAKERVARALATRQPVVSDLFVGAASQRLVTTIYLPVSAPTQRPYVLAQAFSVDHWRKTALQPRGQANWVVGVLDRNGRFIARSHLADTYLGQQARPELVAAAAASREGLIRHKTLENIDAYDAFTHSELTGWTIAVAAPVETIESSAWKAVSWLVAGVATALGVALAAALVIGSRFMQALAVTFEAARALGKGRQPAPARTPVHEINTLNEALCDAGRRLAAEQHSREAVEIERAELLRREITAREEAQKQNAAKDHFLAMLGHELRNPLAGIAGATALLIRGRSDAAAQARYLGIIDRQNRHLGRIIDDLLEVSRAMSGKIVLARAPLDLAECVSSCVEALRTNERAIGHVLALEARPVWVDADPVRLEQIVNNLVANALKFSAPAETILVKVHAHDAQAILEVTDHGAGIGTELLQHIFEPFVQGPGLPGRVQSGLGIGLALVKQLVTLHDGHVHVRSDGPGRGSTFTVTLPKLHTPPPLDARPEPLTLSKCRVLLVDDNADAKLTTAELLRGLGYEVTEAADGEQALRLAREWRPDAVVMDIGLPGLDGYEVAAVLRSQPGLAQVPLIALTGYGEDRQRREAVASKFDEHLVKPVKPDTLALAIEQQLTRKRRAAAAG